ncbi:MAG: DUF6457 domain-containing protein [Solirubrobacteraceae bacterium]
MNAPDWLAAYAERLGVPAPTKDELKAVLDLAGEAAHRSQRISAPVACWLAARAGVGLEEALAIAQQVPGGDDAAGGGPSGRPGVGDG